MMDQNKNNKRFLKCFLASMVIVILICLIHVSGTLAQWSPYNNVGWASQPFFDSSFFSFNPLFSYTGSFDSGFSTPYGNYPSPIAYLSPGLLSLELERYNNFSYNDIFSPYSSFISSGSLFGPAFSSFPQFLYPRFTSYNTFLPNVSSPLTFNMFNPYIASNDLVWYPPWPYPPIPPPPLTFPTPKSPDYTYIPAEAPVVMAGEWRSQQLTDGTGRKMQGTLSIDRKDENHEILKMLNSSLPLGEGSLIEFIYTPTNGKASISFKARFNSNYSVEFTGTADNGLCPKNVFCGHAGYFTVEGQYVVKSNEGQIADKGTFDLEF